MNDELIDMPLAPHEWPRTTIRLRFVPRAEYVPPKTNLLMRDKKTHEEAMEEVRRDALEDTY